MESVATFLPEIDRRRRRAITAGGKFSGIAVGEDTVAGLHQGKSVLPDGLADGDILLLDRDGFLF